MRTSTSPAAGFGVGTSSSLRTSGPPNSRTRIAFIFQSPSLLGHELVHSAKMYHDVAIASHAPNAHRSMSLHRYDPTGRAHANYRTAEIDSRARRRGRVAAHGARSSRFR